jgi:hypothetical protein
VSALVVAIAIAAVAPAADARHRRVARGSTATAHGKQQSQPRVRGDCTGCPTTRTMRPQQAAAVAEQPQPEASERTTPEAGEKATPDHLRGRHRAQPRGEVSKRTRNWFLHLAEALHIYHPQAHPKKGDRGRFTEERPWFEVVGSLFGIDTGVTVSEITRVAGRGSVELVHVAGYDGISQNFETVLARREIGAGQRIELQGPAINTIAGMPIGFRILGLGITSDLFEPGQRRAISYTGEIKLTERSVLYWAPFWAPGAAGAMDSMLGSAGEHTVASFVGGALPFVSAALAVQSSVRAWRTFKNPSAGKLEKSLAAGHAVADVVRIGLPVVGTLANVALVAVTAGISFAKVRRAKAEAHRRAAERTAARVRMRCAAGDCTH